MAKLFTHHDPYRIHALCGLIVVLHFLYRFRLLILDEKDSGFGVHLGQDLLSLLIMTLSPITSFQFFVPTKRIDADGFSIWKEYRWHAFIFNFYVWVMLAMYVYERHFLYEKPKYGEAYRFVIMMVTKYLAKMATDAYPPQVSSVRGVYKGSVVVMVGYMQFVGHALLVTGTPRDEINMPILAIFIVQFNAFLMTLRKKRIIHHALGSGYYVFMLAAAFYLLVIRRFYADPPHGLFDVRLKCLYIATIAYILRCNLGWDRFTPWVAAMACVQIAKQQFGCFQEYTI